MGQIGWDEAVPSDGESAGLGDDRIRSLKTSLRIGLDTEHNWPSAGGDVGQHRYGSARPYYGTQSAVSSSGTDGRLMQASDTSRLFGVGSGGTTYLGGPTVLSAGSFPGTLPQRHQWVEEWGDGFINSVSGFTTVTFPNSGFSGVPYVQVTGTSFGAIIFSVTTNNGSVCSVGAYLATGGPATPGTFPFFWRSVGSRVL